MISVMIYLSSALMAYNIARYIGFIRRMKWVGNDTAVHAALYTPLVLLILFFIGYITVGLFGRPDPVVAGILAGGAVFVLIIMSLMYYIVDRVRESEKQLSKMEEYRRASEAKTTFLSNMSHDIRTPMNAIIGFTKLAKRPETDEAGMRVYLDKIDASSQHMLGLINDILEMSRIESGKYVLTPGRTDLRAVMQDIRDIFIAQMEEKSLSFTVSCVDVTDPVVLCDRNALNRVLLNLVSNACKFTPAGGTVDVTLIQKSAVNAATVKGLTGGGSADEGMKTGAHEDIHDAGGSEKITGMAAYELRVKDSGIGMSREFAERVFDAFERERTSTVSGIQGTGLGMAITKSIVDRMHGTIEVETEPGKGTEFIVSLHFSVLSAETAGAPQTISEAAEADCPQVNFHGKRLLLVEDNEVNREIAAELLKEMGFLLEYAPDGEVAVACVTEAEAGFFDAVLMDVQMPVMNGYDACRGIRALPDKAKASVPVIAMTANAFAEDIENEKKAGMDAHISKPLDISEMVKILCEVLARGEE